MKTQLDRMEADIKLRFHSDLSLSPQLHMSSTLPKKQLAGLDAFWQQPPTWRSVEVGRPSQDSGSDAVVPTDLVMMTSGSNGGSYIL